MGSTRPILFYSALRVAAFVVPFIILLFLDVWWWVAMIVALVVAACISYLFLHRQRDAVSATINRWRRGDNNRDEDNDVENAALDARTRPEGETRDT